jgi:hypothetical protein
MRHYGPVRSGSKDPRDNLKGDLMAKTAKKKTARKANAAFMKPMTPSAALGEVIGDKPMPRTEVTKKLWAYIKKNGLQDAKNRRNINADDKLKPVFAGKKNGQHVRDDEAGQQAPEVSRLCSGRWFVVGRWRARPSTNHQPPTSSHVHRAFRPGLRGEAVGTQPVACRAVRRGAVR